MTTQKLAKQEAAAWLTGARAAEMEYPGLFERAEAEMLRAGKPGLDYVQVQTLAMAYLDKCLSPAGRLAVFNAGNSPAAYAEHVDRLAYSRMTGVIGLSCKYRWTQQVISMDPTVSESLAFDPKEPDGWVGDDGEPLPTDLLSRLPFETFVIVPNFGEVSSFMVECDYRKHSGAEGLYLSVLARVPGPDGTVTMMNGATILVPGLSLASAVKRTGVLFEQTITTFGDAADLMNPEKAQVTELVNMSVLSRVLPYLLYLCAENRELDDDAPAPLSVTRTKRGPRIFIPEKPRVMEAGIRIGAAIRAARDAAARSEPGEPSGLSLTPHLRKAHWHAYWMGPRNDMSKRRKAIHFLPPIAVNVNRMSDLQAVVRPAA